MRMFLPTCPILAMSRRLEPVLHRQPHECLYSRHISTPHKRSLRPTSTSPEPLRARLSKTKTSSVAHSTETQPAREPIHSTSRQSPTALVTLNPHSTDRGTRTNHPQNPPLAPLESPRKGLSNEPLVAHSTEAQQARDPTHNTSSQSPTALATLTKPKLNRPQTEK